MNGRDVVELMLAFADDVAFFCCASKKSFQTLREILHEFTSFSGLELNRHKSNVIFSKRVQDGGSLAQIFGFQLQSFSIHYLGLLVTG